MSIQSGVNQIIGSGLGGIVAGKHLMQQKNAIKESLNDQLVNTDLEILKTEELSQNVESEISNLTAQRENLTPDVQQTERGAYRDTKTGRYVNKEKFEESNQRFAEEDLRLENSIIQYKKSLDNLKKQQTQLQLQRTNLDTRLNAYRSRKEKKQLAQGGNK